MAEPKLYAFSTHIGTACNKQSRTFADLAEKLKLDATDLMRQCNGKAPPSKGVGQGPGPGTGDQRIVSGKTDGRSEEGPGGEMIRKTKTGKSRHTNPVPFQGSLVFRVSQVFKPLSRLWW